MTNVLVKNLSGFSNILKKWLPHPLFVFVFLAVIFPIAAVAILFSLIYEEMARPRGILSAVLFTMHIFGALLFLFSIVLFRQGNLKNGAEVLFFGTCLFCIPINAVSYAKICRDNERG